MQLLSLFSYCQFITVFVLFLGMLSTCKWWQIFIPIIAGCSYAKSSKIPIITQGKRCLSIACHIWMPRNYNEKTTIHWILGLKEVWIWVLRVGWTRNWDEYLPYSRNIWNVRRQARSLNGLWKCRKTKCFIVFQELIKHSKHINSDKVSLEKALTAMQVSLLSQSCRR